MTAEQGEVAFPGHVVGSSARVTRTRTFRAWVGTSDRLRRVVSIMESSLRTAFDQAKSDIEQMPTWQRESALKGFAIVTEISEGRDKMERSGELDALLAQVDLSEVRAVRTDTLHQFDANPRASVKIKFDSRGLYDASG